MGSGTELKKQIDQLLQSSNTESRLDLKRDFPEVVLTEEETEEALRVAREQKHYLLRKISYLQALNEPIVPKSYTAEQIKDFLGKVITIDSYNESIVWLMCLYFSGDERFALEGFDLNKGICLFGGVGVGKTTLMEKFFQNQRQSFVIKMCRAIEDQFSQDGDIVLREYGIQRACSINGDHYGHQILGYCFDDLGTEPPSKYYGKNTDVMAEVILNRYDNRIPYTQTHITTNLSTDEIINRYGSRVADRMQQMFNMIAFDSKAKSRRK